jgi:hypothetical protein
LFQLLTSSLKSLGEAGARKFATMHGRTLGSEVGNVGKRRHIDKLVGVVLVIGYRNGVVGMNLVSVMIFWSFGSFLVCSSLSSQRQETSRINRLDDTNAESKGVTVTLW